MLIYLFKLVFASFFIFILIFSVLLYVYFNPLFFVKKFMRKEYSKEELLKQVMYPKDFETKYLPNATIESDLIYSTKFDNSTYDLYLPKTISKKLPLIIWIHGGAFVAGEKEGTYALGHMLATDNFITLSINYKLAPEASFFDIAHQIESLMEHIFIKYKDDPRIDLNKIIFAGDSAGGHIALSYVLTQFNQEFSNKMNIKSKYKDNIKGILLLCNPYDLVILSKQKSLKMKFFVNAFARQYFRQGKWKKENGLLGTYYQYVTDDFAPCYLTDGNSFSFMVQSKKFKKALDEHHVYNESLYFEEPNHKVNHEYNFELNTDEAMINYEKMVNFINKIIDKK